MCLFCCQSMFIIGIIADKGFSANFDFLACCCLECMGWVRVNRVEGVLTNSAGGRGRVKQVWERSDLFRSLGLTGRIEDEEDEEVWVAARLHGKQQGVCAPLGWATLPAGMWRGAD